jgi:hypothetical protein
MRTIRRSRTPTQGDLRLDPSIDKEGWPDLARRIRARGVIKPSQAKPIDQQARSSPTSNEA